MSQLLKKRPSNNNLFGIHNQGTEVHEWITTLQFSELAGLGERQARRALVSCHSGGKWNGVSLIVRYEGKALQVYAPQSPPLNCAIFGMIVTKPLPALRKLMR